MLLCWLVCEFDVGSVTENYADDSMESILHIDINS